MSSIPRLSYDLISTLDEQEKVPQFPTTKMAAVNLDESQIRLGIWHAARRALVDDLLAMREEDENETEDMPTTAGNGPGNLLDRPILDSSLSPHTGVASAYLAPTGVADDSDYVR